MTSPICTVNASTTENGVDVAPGSLVTIALASVAGVKTWSIQCIGTDETSNAATVNAGLTVNAPPVGTATYSHPGYGTALIFRSVVNGGVDVNGKPRPEWTTTFKVSCVTQVIDLRVGALNETFENDASFGSLRLLNAALRAVEKRIGGVPQQTATVSDSSPHTPGTGVDLPPDTDTSLDAEIWARDGSGNWAWWRITQGYRRVGTGVPSAVSGSVTTSTGFPKGSNGGAPPSSWSVGFALGTGVNANTAFVQITGPATWRWYVDGSRYPADELALAITVSGVFPNNGPTAGGTLAPTFVSIVPSSGSTAGGP